MGGHHHLIQFHLNTLATDNLDALGHVPQGIEGFILYLEIQLGSEPYATHHT